MGAITITSMEIANTANETSVATVKNVRDLAKSLSKDKTVKEKNGTNSTFVPGVNVYYSKKK
jgi:hypothetical protein